jgi:hypothetical protein
MPLPYIYADFNALGNVGEGELFAEMDLTGYGTLASLARQRLRLKEGMEFFLFEPNDIECRAVAHFDPTRIDPAGRVGSWVARIPSPVTTRQSEQPEANSNEHPCIVCGSDFADEFAKVGRHYTEECAKCGASVMEPMAPPKRGA